MKKISMTATILAATFGTSGAAHAATYTANTDIKPTTLVSSDLDVLSPEAGNEHNWDPEKGTEVRILVSEDLRVRRSD